MRNVRMILASMLSLFLLLGMMSWMADESYERAMPKVKERLAKAKARRSQFAELSQEEIDHLSGTLTPNDSSANPLVDRMWFESPRRPIGTWIGVCQTDERRIAIMKFDSERYALVVKSGGNESTERGRYDFAYDYIAFEPDDGQAYNLDYLVPARDCVEMSGSSRSLRLERTDAVDINI